MNSELLSVLKKIVNDANSDYVFKKSLPSEQIIVELRTTDSGYIYVKIDENGLGIFESFCDHPDSIIISNSETLTKLLKGELDPVKAFFFGRVKVEGSLDLAYILHERLKEYQKIRRSMTS